MYMTKEKRKSIWQSQDKDEAVWCFRLVYYRGKCLHIFRRNGTPFFLGSLSAGYKSFWRSPNEKETARKTESRNRGGRESDDGDPSSGHTCTFIPFTFGCMNKRSPLASFLGKERWSDVSFSSNMQNSKTGELMERGRLLLKKLSLLPSKDGGGR